MSKFEVRGTELAKSKDQKMTFADLLLLSMKNVPANGLTVGEMSDRLEVVAKLKEAKVGETIEFEPEQLTIIKECVEVMRWNVCDETIKDFGEYVASLG